MTDKMTPKQAISEIKYNECNMECRIDYEDCNNDICRFKLAIESLEKQIPKKPEYTKTNTPYCPVCGDLLAEDFCGDCGQAILWESDTE